MNNNVFQEELLSDEKIIWTGKPEESKLFSKFDIFLVPFSLLWGGFAIFWELTSITMGAPFFFSLFGLPFVLMGLYFIFGRFIYKRYKKRNIYYAVTNQRVLVVTKLRNKNIQASFIKNIPTINKYKNSLGLGSIRFGNSHFFTSMYGNMGMDFFGFDDKEVINFYDIEDVDRVYKIVDDIRKGL